MNNEKVAEYLDTISALYYKGVDFARTEPAKKARKKNGVLYKNAAKAVRAQTQKVSEMTVEQMTDKDTGINGVGPAIAETITALVGGGEDRPTLAKFLLEYVKEYPDAETFLKERESAQTGREKLNNLSNILSVSQGKSYFSSIDWFYHLVMLAEGLKFLDRKEHLPLVYETMEKVRAAADSDLIDLNAFSEEEQKTASFSHLGVSDKAAAALVRYLARDKGVPSSVFGMALDTYLAYDDTMKKDTELLRDNLPEYLSLEALIEDLELVDSPQIPTLEEMLKLTAEEHFENYERQLAKAKPATPPAPKPEAKPVAPAPKSDKRTYRQRIVDLLGSMADGYAQTGRIQLSNLYRETAMRIEGAIGKQFQFNNLNELKQVLYRRKFLAPTEITDFIARYENSKLSDEEKKVLLRGEKQYSERKEKEVVGDTPITKPEIITFLNLLADSESRSGSAENARIYREVVERLNKAKAQVNNAKEGYEQIWYGKPLLPLEVALIVEEYAAKSKKKAVKPSFDFKSLLSKKAYNLFQNEDITIEMLASNKEELSEADRLLLYWGPSLTPSTREQAKAILVACSLKGGMSVDNGQQIWKPKETTLSKALAGPLSLFTRAHFTVKDETYLILQVAGTEPPFLLKVTE